MRLPFPEKITPWHAGCFAGLLCAFEILQGTPPLFVACVFAYIMMATMAFNVVGGLYRASGAYIFANSMLSIIFALCAKVVLGESADSNLRDPMITIFVYMAGMAGILLAAIVSRKLIAKVALLERNDVPEDNRQIAIGCVAAGIGLPFLAGILSYGSTSGSLSSALNQFTQFLPLGMVLAIYDEIRTSHGRRSINTIFIAGSIFIIVWGGILGTSKQAFFTPLAVYFATCGVLRYKFRLSGIIGIVLAVFILFYYMVPYAQIVRNYTRDMPLNEQIDASIYWLSNLDAVRAEYAGKTAEEVELSTTPHYFSQDEGIAERFSMIAIDDSLIDVADKGTKFGYMPILNGVANIIPHVLWPNKPNINYANVYGHAVNVIGDEDTDTSVSFGPAADGYFMAGWLGVFVLLPIMTTIMFVIVDSVSGSLKKTPWGLAYTIYFFHFAPEGTISGMIVVCAQISVIIVVSVYAARYALPIIGSIFSVERRKTKLMKKVGDFPRAAVPAAPEIADKPA